ncbi:MAG: UDP-glucose 4-epimerase GalE [Anaerolineaceae bacterium]|nr:UDP-glucose 4-epimerase GalE [Anaerolineaceae bacterium]MDE0327568.1 UDP-glucose 4-epimerase GalE [Anaerolineaceae bacterium]
MKLLVTGGAGYIGSHVTDLLVARGDEVVVCDNLVNGHRQAVHPAARFVHGDLLQADTLRRLFDGQRYDGILHFAAYTLVNESMERPWRYLRDNVLAGGNLLQAAAEQGIPRFILSSTANLYEAPQRLPIGEDEPVRPGSPYGEGKHMIERMLGWMNRLRGMAGCSLRYFNAAGAHPDGHIGEDHRPETHLIPLVLQVALGQREAITVFGADYPTPDGSCIRDYIHVMDLAAAHILALDALEEGELRACNLGSGHGHSVLEVLECARQVTGHAIPTRIGPRRAGDPAVLVADSDALGRWLGWAPQHRALQPIIASAWNWHRRHPQGYPEDDP